MNAEADEKNRLESEEQAEAAQPAGAEQSQSEQPAGHGKELSQEQIEQLQKKAAERDEFLDLLQRLRADFANYQKRMQKERETERRYAPMPLIADLLGVLDNFERAIEAAEAEEASPGLLHGIRMIYEQLRDTLQRHGVQPIEADGQRFDPDVHEAVMKEETDHTPHGTVIRTLQRGYKLHDRVVRPAKVVVAAQPEQVVAETHEDAGQASEQEQLPPSDGRKRGHAGP